MRLFIELLDESLENGRKVVVFSQYLGMLDLMAHHLTAKVSDLPPCGAT